MKIVALLKNRYSLGLLVLMGGIALLLISPSQVDEKIPEIVSITNAPELSSYVVEFSKPVAREPIVTVAERKEPVIPVDHSLIQGRVLGVDHNTNCSLWVIQSYKGSNWMDQQKLYVYLEKQKELQEITAFAGRVIESPFVLSTEDCAKPFLVMGVTRRNEYAPWADELWTYTLQTKELKRISVGGWVGISPDRSMVTFWKSSKDNNWMNSGGFHCLYLWDIKSGQIEPVISMWESDPGSGTSWDYRWSADSKAINITGNCGGFSRNGERKYTELNLIYLVKDKKMFSVGHP